MGYLKRLILVNSAGYPLADVRLDGHCDIAGGQGVGKTTLMNAILYPFVVEDRFIDIDRLEKQRFSLYYFPSERNSFVIYEVVNNLGAPYCILIHRSGATLYYHFISAPFDFEWIYEGEEQVKDWQDIRAKLNRLGITFKTEDKREKFNNIFLGKGEHYHEQYSIVKSNKDKDAIRPLLSAIFRNLPFSQETLKNALVAAVMSSNQLENEGIDLASHRRNLDGFAERYSDIRKMTVRDAGGKTAVDPIAEILFDAVDRYYHNMEERRKVPGKLVYAYAAAKGRVATLESALAENEEARKKLINGWNDREKELDGQIGEAISTRGGMLKELETIGEIEAKYREKKIHVDELVTWILDKQAHVQSLKSIEKQRNALTADAEDIQAQKEAALQENELFYKNLEVLEKTKFSKILDSLNKKKEDVQSVAERERFEVEKKYKGLLGVNWRETEQKLIDALLDISMKLATAETIDDVRTAFERLPAEFTYNGLLTDVLTRRNGDARDIDLLRKEADAARKRIEEELDRKIQLEDEMRQELADISARKKKAFKEIDFEVGEATKEDNLERKRIFEEHRDKAEEISSVYDTKIHGNNEEIKAALDELNELIDGEKSILSAIEAFPSAAEDKERYFDRKPDLLKQKEVLNLRINSLRDQKSQEKAQFEEAKAALESKLSQDKADRDGLVTGIQETDRFLDTKSDVKAAYESASPIENVSSLSDIRLDYSTINGNIDELKERICQFARRLYEPGMLSRLDTFQLGFGYNDSLSRFEDFLGIAEKLRTRMENSAEAMGMDKFVQLYSVTWLSEIKDIDTAMSPIENMLQQIGKLCSRATAFVKKHNTTDCIDSFSMTIDEEDTPDVVKLMRTISGFFKRNNTMLGFDNLFASDDGSVNKQAVDYLSQFADILNKDLDLKMVSLSSMFNIRMDIVEKGNAIKNLLSFNNPGSRGTAIVLKAMLNMTLLHIVLEKNQAKNTRLICAIDEMNTIEARNLDALTDFASAAGLYIIGSGQHHTKSALDYSYNVWDERGEDGVVYKYVSMDAMESATAEDDVQ